MFQLYCIDQGTTHSVHSHKPLVHRTSLYFLLSSYAHPIRRLHHSTTIVQDRERHSHNRRAFHFLQQEEDAPHGTPFEGPQNTQQNFYLGPLSMHATGPHRPEDPTRSVPSCSIGFASCRSMVSPGHVTLPGVYCVRYPQTTS